MDKFRSQIINVCLSCDENYAKQAGTVVASIISNAGISDKLHFYILDGGISQESKEKILSLKSIGDFEIEFVKVNKDDFKEYKKIKTHFYISLAACYRLKLATLLSNIDKVIYLDCDVLVCSSLNDLFEVNLEDKVIAGVLDIDLKRKNRNPNYVNSGVLLMDLAKIREQNIENEFLDYAKQNSDTIEMGDQEIINAVLSDRILIIDSKFNVQSECYIRRSSFTKAPAIIHFVGPQKPWNFGSWSVHKDLYFKYLQMTPWKLDNKELFKWELPNKIYSFYTWFLHRPIFYLQAKFWEAVNKDIRTQDSPKIFVAVLMACFGDVILCSALFQNIKRLYPNSKTIFIVDKPWQQAAKYQPCVDEVIIFDKRGENRGFLGLLKFIAKFPYKKIDYVFKIYDNSRVDLISAFLMPKKIIGKPYDGKVCVQERHANLLKKITKEKIINVPIQYCAENQIPEKLKGVISKEGRYIGLCTTSKMEEKDMPLQTAVQLIESINNIGYEVLLLGSGEKAKKYSLDLENNNCKFIDLVNKTSIYELAQVLRSCKACVSVDTGTMHFSYANGVPTVCVFYKDTNILHWAPNKNLYPFTTITSSNEGNEIFNVFMALNAQLHSENSRSIS